MAATKTRSAGAWMTMRGKLIIVGATGMIGAGIVEELAGDFEIITAARGSGDVRVDASSPDSVAAMFAAIGPYDGLISVFGSGVMGSFEVSMDAAFEEGFRSKTLSQIRLVRMGLATINDGGSFTLTSGILSQEPYPGFSAVATVNGAVDAFCRGASVEMPRSVRINCVTPVFMTESLSRAGLADCDYPKLSVRDTAKGYRWCVEGTFSGHVIDARLPREQAINKRMQ
jgi:NAD(P)-dependent dehydrogenase (short-subunit alcohol dehydrogenase family)